MILAALLAVASFPPNVQLSRVPNGGIQPQLVRDANGTEHLLYYSGDPAHGDLFYMRSTDDGKSWDKAVQVNHEPGDAIAIGTIRGGQLAVAGGRVYVVWNGSRSKPNSKESPLYFTRLKPDGAFEPERDLLGSTKSLDGGASIAADGSSVYVLWHASDGAGALEKKRKVWIARSTDSGGTFETERPIWAEPTGACGCCSVKALAANGSLWVTYRSAKQEIDRDSYLMKSSDGGKTFTGEMVSRWRINSCPMSSYWLQNTSRGVLVGVEENGAVVFMNQGKSGVGAPFRPAIYQATAKYPTAATNANGVTLYAWTEGMGWNKGGSVVWRGFDAKGEPVPGMEGRREGVPVWSMVAVVARRDGSFGIYY